MTIAKLLCCMFLATFINSSHGDDYRRNRPVLRSFKDYVNDFEWNPDGVYRFVYHAGDSYRSEQRTASGEVAGTYEFLAPEGEEYKFKYEADKTGYHVDSDALPQAPEETDEVKIAREAFFEAYREAALRADEEEYSYGHEYNANNEQSLVTYQRPSPQSSTPNKRITRPRNSRPQYQSAYKAPSYNSGYSYNKNYVQERTPVQISAHEDYVYKQEEQKSEYEDEEEDEEEDDDDDDDDDDSDEDSESSEESSEEDEDDDNDLANYAAFSHFGVRLNNYDSDEDDDSSSSESDEDDDDDDDDDDDEEEEDEEDEEESQNKGSELGYQPRRKFHVKVQKRPLTNTYGHFGRRTTARRRRV